MRWKGWVSNEIDASMHGQRGHVTILRTQLVEAYHQHQPNLEETTRAWVHNRISEQKSVRGSHRGKTNGRSSNSTGRIFKALSDTRRRHQVGSEATSSTLWRHPDSYTHVHPGAKGFLGNFQMGWESVNCEWQGTNAIHEEVFVATRLHAGWATHSANFSTILPSSALRHRTDYLQHAS